MCMMMYGPCAWTCILPGYLCTDAQLHQYTTCVHRLPRASSPALSELPALRFAPPPTARSGEWSSDAHAPKSYELSSPPRLPPSASSPCFSVLLHPSLPLPPSLFSFLLPPTPSLCFLSPRSPSNSLPLPLSLPPCLFLSLPPCLFLPTSLQCVATLVRSHTSLAFLGGCPLPYLVASSFSCHRSRARSDS